LGRCWAGNDCCFGADVVMVMAPLWALVGLGGGLVTHWGVA
jgi:hypothetical protein